MIHTQTSLCNSHMPSILCLQPHAFSLIHSVSDCVYIELRIVPDGNREDTHFSKIIILVRKSGESPTVILIRGWPPIILLGAKRPPGRQLNFSGSEIGFETQGFSSWNWSESDSSIRERWLARLSLFHVVSHAIATVMITILLITIV